MNSEAAFDDMGSASAIYSRLAYYALLEDVREHLSGCGTCASAPETEAQKDTAAKLGEGFDIDDDATWPANREDS